MGERSVRRVSPPVPLDKGVELLPLVADQGSNLHKGGTLASLSPDFEGLWLKAQVLGGLLGGQQAEGGAAELAARSFGRRLSMRGLAPALRSVWRESHGFLVTGWRTSPFRNFRRRATAPLALYVCRSRGAVDRGSRPLAFTAPPVSESETPAASRRIPELHPAQLALNTIDLRDLPS